MDFYNSYNLEVANVMSREREIRLPEWAKAENMEMCFSQKEIFDLVNGRVEKPSMPKKSAGAVVRMSVANELRRIANIISPEIQVG